MPSTNMGRPKMVLAGVDAGARIFVELKGNPVVAALAIAVTHSDARTLFAPRRVKFVSVPHISDTKRRTG